MRRRFGGIHAIAGAAHLILILGLILSRSISSKVNKMVGVADAIARGDAIIDPAMTKSLLEEVRHAAHIEGLGELHPVLVVLALRVRDLERVVLILERRLV